MQLETQVISLELAKKLKELGVKQDSLFYWQYSMTLPVDKDGNYQNWYINYGDSSVAKDAPSAFTVAELGELLPNEVRDKCAFFSGKAINGWFCEVKNYRVMPYERLHVELQHDTEADARAKMLIYLIENELLDPKTLSV